MTIRLKDLCEQIGARCVRGNEDILIRAVAPLADAGTGDLCFLASPKYLDDACASKASAIIAEKEIPGIRATLLLTDNPYLSWAKATELFKPDRSCHLPREIDPCASVHPDATVESGVHVGAKAVIGAGSLIESGVIIHCGAVVEENCRIGRDTEIHPNAVIHYGSTIGQRCIIWSNAVIGAYGFGNAKDGAHFVGIHQLGSVRIEDDVSIGAGATVDRGAIEDTIIRKGAKIDNLVMIAHNVIIGENSAIAAQTGISGSTRIGDRVLIAGQAGFVGHIEIGHDSFVGAQAGVAKSFPPGSKITGYPARNLMDVRRSDSAITHLPELMRRVRELEKKFEEFGLD
ncbi:MAG: UDP-3-O-(3-hydroxymyristoyl)glucosamine N-acyltransferase [Methylococcaceae bacterium]|nr:UDP-3-O-(3-hydroxymyristoyl)glucosamine N-acyltransferase [Methylococcaceae bacterium]